MHGARNSAGGHDLAVDGEDGVLAERVAGLAAWVHELELRVHATEAADPETLKELGRALEAWSRHDPDLEHRVTARVEAIAGRLTSLVETVNATSAALAGRDGERAAFRRELEHTNRRIEELGSELRHAGSPAELEELRQAVRSLAADRHLRASPRDDLMPGQAEALRERIDMLATTVATTAAGVARRESELSAMRRELDAISARGLQTGADAGGDRLRLLESALGAVRHEVEALAGRVAEIASDVERTVGDLAAKELELAAIHRHFGEAGARVDTVLGDLRAALATVPAPGTIDPAVSSRLERLDRQVHALTAHLAELEADASRPGLASDLLGEVQQRLERLERAGTGRTEEAHAVRALVDGLRMRLASAEKGLAELARSPDDVGRRLEDLASRLVAVERGGHALAVGSALPPVAGDGRFRVELRALELRIEHAEAAARESREAVLVQLERLASRIEWRLQRLETGTQEAPRPADEPDAHLGQVVHLRSEA